MTLLPGSWALVLLGEAGSWRGGGTPSKDVPEFWLNGYVPWVSPKDMKTELIRDSEDHITDSAIEQSAISRVPAGSVLVVTRSGILARTLPVAVTGVEVTVNQDLKALTPDKWVEANFVAWALRAFGSDILERCKKDGTTVASIDSEALRRYQVPLAPHNEQRRVVEAIDSYLTRLNHAVASLERVQAKLKAYRATVLKAAVEGRLVPTEASLARAERRDYEPAETLLARILKERRRRWEEAELTKLNAAGKTPKDDKWKAKYQEPAAPDTSTLPELPEGWCWVTVDQLAGHGDNTLCDGPFGSNLKTEHYTDHGPRVVRLQNIGDGVFHDEEAHISDSHFARLRKHEVLPGDLLVASLGTQLPRACLAPEWLGPAIVKADCLRFAVNPQLAEALYVLHALNSAPTRKRLENLVHGVGRPRIGLGLFRTTTVPLPPRAEQARITAFVEQLVSTSSVIQQNAALDSRLCARLRQAVLKWAFEGKLVDQDPTDEPAEQLLARIRAERAAAPTTNKSSRGRRAKGAA